MIPSDARARRMTPTLFLSVFAVCRVVLGELDATRGSTIPITLVHGRAIGAVRLRSGAMSIDIRHKVL